MPPIKVATEEMCIQRMIIYSTSPISLEYTIGL
jgi:hypothetical protein